MATTWYFDADNGSDSNNGTSSSTPKQWWRTFVQGNSAAGDTFLFKSGTTQVLTSDFTAFRAGSSDSVRSRFAVYGGSGYVTWSSSVGTMVINVAGRQYIDVEDMRFDGNGVVTNCIYAAVQGASNMGNHRFFRCHFKNAAITGFNVGIESLKTGVPVNFVLEDCEFYDNGGHGLFLAGIAGASVKRCKAYRNGATLSTGGHGFSFGAAKTTASSGWTLASGAIWQRTLAANELDVYYVQTSTALYPRLNKNTATPTAPVAGEFGVSGGVLYINVNTSGTNPSGQGVIYAWLRAYGITVEDCEAYGNIWNRAAAFHEGHGFAFDDFTDYSAFLRNYSHDNQGLGFSINRGDGNRLVGNVATGNWQGAVSVNTSSGTQLVNNTFFNNNCGTDPLDAEITLGGYTKNAVISNNILAGTTAYGINISATGTSGHSGVTNNISGFGTADKTAVVTGTVTTDPALDPGFRTSVSAVNSGGTVLLGVDFYGREFPVTTPPIGAVSYRSQTDRAVTSRPISSRRAITSG